MFKVKTYEITENWLDRRTFRNYGPNKKYLTKADIYHTVYDLLREYRYEVFNFEVGIANDRVKYTVRVDNTSINVYDGKKLLYEETFLAPDGFDRFADWLAWKMVDDR